MGAPVVAVAGVLISLFLCIIGAGATKTVIFSGGIHHGRTQVGVGETIVVKMSSLKTTGSLPVLDTGIFSFPGSSSDNIFEVSFTQLSYLHSDNCSLRIYNSASSSGTRILAHYEKKNQRLMRVLSSTNTIYVEMRVSALSRGKQDFDITMKLYPLKESTTDFYTEQYSTIQGLYVNDGKTRTAIAGSELAYDSGNVYVFNSIEYRAAGAGNNPTARQFRVTFSPESYIKTSGIVVVIRDGPSDSSKSLVRRSYSLFVHIVELTSGNNDMTMSLQGKLVMNEMYVGMASIHFVVHFFGAHTCYISVIISFELHWRALQISM